MTRIEGRDGWVWFLAWFGLGVGWALALLGAMTIGIFVVPIVAAVTIFVATRRHSADGIPGIISGLGLPALYVAYLNRQGPGTICRSYADGSTSCVEEWSPWPWVGVGVALVAIGVVVFAVGRNRRAGAAGEPMSQQ